MRAYVPSRYQVCYSGRDEEPIERPRILDVLPAPAADLFRARVAERGEFRDQRGLVRYWCTFVTTEEARELAEGLEEAKASSEIQRPSYILTYAFSPSGVSHVEVDIELMPDDPPA